MDRGEPVANVVLLAGCSAQERVGKHACCLQLAVGNKLPTGKIIRSPEFKISSSVSDLNGQAYVERVAQMRSFGSR